MNARDGTFDAEWNDLRSELRSRVGGNVSAKTVRPNRPGIEGGIGKSMSTDAGKRRDAGQAGAGGGDGAAVSRMRLPSTTRPTAPLLVSK